MNMLLVKTALISFTASIIGGILPIRKHKQNHGEWMHYIDLFCDAMFIAIAIGHLLPELYFHNTWTHFIILTILAAITAYGIQSVNRTEGSKFRNFFIIIFFSHCFIEGLALPIIHDHHVQTTLSVTILAHKIIEPFVFFNLLSRQNWSQRHLILLLLLFASLTPLGIITGHYVRHLPEIFSSIVNALTCGTFIGISTNCYFNNTCHTHHHKKWVMLCFLALSLLLVSLTGHHHH